MEVDCAVDGPLALLVLGDGVRQREDALLVDAALHEVVERLQAEVSQLVLLGEVAHRPDDVHLRRPLHVQRQLLARLHLYPQSLAAQPDEVLLPALALLHDELQDLRVRLQEFVAEVLDEVLVRVELLRPALIQTKDVGHYAQILGLAGQRKLVLRYDFGPAAVGVVDVEYHPQKRQDGCQFFDLVVALGPGEGDQLDVVLGQFEGVHAFRLSVADVPEEDPAAGVDDDGVALDLSGDPLGEAEHEVFVDEEAEPVRQLVLGLALVPSVPEINHGEHPYSTYIDKLNYIRLTHQNPSLPHSSTCILKLWMP